MFISEVALYFCFSHGNTDHMAGAITIAYHYSFKMLYATLLIIISAFVAAPG